MDNAYIRINTHRLQNPWENT